MPTAQPQIENLRNYPAPAVERLRALLNSGAPQREDAHRAHFFELEDEDQVFYFYLSPTSEKVILLSTWTRDPEPAKLAGKAA